jgi:hypothetical protein
VKALYGDAGKKTLESAFQQPLPAQMGGNVSIAPEWLKALAKWPK